MRDRRPRRPTVISRPAAVARRSARGLRGRRGVLLAAAAYLAVVLGAACFAASALGTGTVSPAESGPPPGGATIRH
jgi:hypothetical protein